MSRKEDTLIIVFSDEKMFGIDVVYKPRKQGILEINRAEADAKSGILQKRKFPQKMRVRLGVRSKGVSPLVIFGSGKVNHDRYIQGVLAVALKFRNDVFGSQWTYTSGRWREATCSRKVTGMVCCLLSIVRFQGPLAREQSRFRSVR